MSRTCARFYFQKKFHRSPSLQRSEAAAVLIDGLHLRIFVPRQVSRKRLVLHFPEIPRWLPIARLPRMMLTAEAPPLLFLSLNAPLFHLLRIRIDSIGKFRELHADCSKVKQTTPIMQPALQRAELFILQIYYWRGVTTNYWTPSFARCFLSSSPPRARGPAAILFLSQFSKWCFSICASALVSLALEINKGVESGMKSDGGIMKIFLLYYFANFACRERLLCQKTYIGSPTDVIFVLFTIGSRLF